MPAKDAKPETPALKAMLQREYKGFELPERLRDSCCRRPTNLCAKAT